MVDIFISYSRTNQALVRRLAEAVQAEGYSVWWDDELPPHLSYGDVITEKIGQAKAAIVVWSEDAAQSEWVRAEADVARNQKKLIQTSIDGRMPPMPFNQIQFADIGDWNGEADHSGWKKVKASLVALVGPRSPTGATPPAPPPPPVSGISYDPAKGARTSLLIPALLGALILVLLVIAYLLMSRGGEAPVPAPAANVAAPANEVLAQPPVPAPAPVGGTDQLFSVPAVVRNGPADVYDDEDAVIGQVQTGQAVGTYRQEGEYWRVRMADGATGYVSRRQLQIDGDAPPQAAPLGSRPAPPPAPRPRAEQPAPPVREPASSLTPEQEAAVVRNPRMARRYCNGQGRNTPQCRELRERYGQ